MIGACLEYSRYEGRITYNLQDTYDLLAAGVWMPLLEVGMQPFQIVERRGEREGLIVSSAENFLLQPFGIPASMSCRLL